MPAASMLLAGVVLVATSSLFACVGEATSVRIFVGTDVSPTVPLTIRVAVRSGNVMVADGAWDKTWTRGVGDGGIALPASFAIVPDGPEHRNGTVTLVIEGTTPTFTLRRTVRFQFTPGRTTWLPVFLTGQCLLPADGCHEVPDAQCTVQQFCEESNLTCGDDGTCVEVDQPVQNFGDGGPDIASVTDAPSCGAGQTCCTDGTFCATGSVCTSANQCAVCGTGESCCPDGTICPMGQACTPSGACGACGDNNEPCCPGSMCNGGVCSSSTHECEACGAPGQVCCASGRCDSGAQCTSGRCTACGGTGQPCCGGSSCSSGLVCSGGTCVSCSARNQPCCPGSVCDSGLGCSGGTCVCLGLQARCDGSPPCCANSVCAVLVSDNLHHCCRQSGQPCTVSDDCCGTLICWNYGGTTGKRCR